ncbi:MAG: cupin domain-containing protein [Microthrixaceae bacterium]
MGEGSAGIVPGTVIDLEGEVIGLRADGIARLMAHAAGPPLRLDGHTIGLSRLTGDTMPPHNGEMHPDGDEVLIMVSGAIDVDLELDAGAETVRVDPGQALIVPQGVWHLIRLVEPGQLVNITPGPRGDYRPLTE